MQQGRLAGSISGVTPVSGTPNTLDAGGVPAGSRLFLLVYPTLSSSPDLPFGLDFGVFSADNWIMPSDTTQDLVLNTTDVDTASEVFVGSLGPSGSLQMLKNAPEPGTGLLALFAGLLLTRRLRSAP